jgi:hypothetical protein
MVSVGNYFGDVGPEGWLRVDVVRDGIVDIVDIGEIGNHFGETWLLPVNGSEVSYQPGLWNDGGTIQLSTNCYAYALNLVKNPITGQSFPYRGINPGALSGTYVNWILAFQDPNATAIKGACLADANYIGGAFIQVARDYVCQQGEYKVALVIDPYEDEQDITFDYHWYRENPDGRWSHKPGITVVTLLDRSGNGIFDPQLADRVSGYIPGQVPAYTWWIGYFAVKSIPEGALGQRMMQIPKFVFPTDEKYVPILTDPDKALLNIKDLDFITKGMSGSEVREKVGLPQSASGDNHILDIYYLDDGSYVAIDYGFERKEGMQRASIIHPDGTIKSILK